MENADRHIIAAVREAIDGVSSVALSADGRTIVSRSYDQTLKIWDAESGTCRQTHVLGSADALAAWRNVGRLDESRRLSTNGGPLQFPLALLPNKARRTDATTAVAESLIASGNFSQAFGPLAADTILAFTASGEAHWFRLRWRAQTSWLCSARRSRRSVISGESSTPVVSIGWGW